MTNPIGKFKKDPAAVLDYTIDWSRWLAGDTITSASWTVPAGITQTLATNDGSSATVWLSGGTAGTSYTVKGLINTQAGRTDERSILIKVENR